MAKDPDEGDVLSFKATQSDGNKIPKWLDFDMVNCVLMGTPPESTLYEEF